MSVKTYTDSTTRIITKTIEEHVWEIRCDAVGCNNSLEFRENQVQGPTRTNQRMGRRAANPRKRGGGVRHHRRGTGSGYGRLPRSQSEEGSAVSIISSDAKWAVLQRAVRLSPEEARGTTKGKEYEAGFIAGATRRPTNEEIVAGAKAFYEALKPDSYPQWDSDCALRAEYYDAMRLAVKAMQGKASEE